MAEDPGRAYLYIDTGKQNNTIPSNNPTANTQQHEHPRLPTTAGGLDRWGVAMGNLEDARVALDTLSQAIEDAVYLDEDAYNQLIPTMQYTRLIQAQQRRLTELETENENLRVQLNDAQAGRKELEAAVVDLRQELDNNAVVFKMHYNELLAKEDEIMRLKAVVEGLSK